MKRWIPNVITLLNLFCGCAAVISLLYGEWMMAVAFFFAGGVFDFADGLVARLLNVSSEHGKELDSLADMVSFGVVPGVIYYVFLDLQSSLAVSSAAMLSADGFNWAAAPGLLVTLFSALRLAKFNLDTRQSDDFIGLATPSSTLYAVGLLLIYATDAYGWGTLVLSPWVVYPSILVMSYLLISEVPMFSFKLKGFGWNGNQLRIIFVVAVIVLLLLLKLAAFPFIVLTYLLLNIAAAVGQSPKNSKA